MSVSLPVCIWGWHSLVQPLRGGWPLIQAFSKRCAQVYALAGPMHGCFDLASSSSPASRPEGDRWTVQGHTFLHLLAREQGRRITWLSPWQEPVHIPMETCWDDFQSMSLKCGAPASTFRPTGV